VARARNTAFGVAPGVASARGYSISTVGVVGLGSMGHAVAQLCASKGYSVVAVETTEASVNKGLDTIEKSLVFLAGKKVDKGQCSQAEADAEVADTLGRITGATTLDSLGDADLIVEAIVEDLDVKLPFFAELGQKSKSSAILATNTSSFSVGEMAAASGVPERVCGLHYFNPVQVMKLVEVVKTAQTDPAVITAVTDFVTKTGKVPVDCSDTPGFVVNRLLVPYLMQGVAMVARGDASAADVDTAMKLGAGHPMGPIELADYVGLDVCLAIMDGWVAKYPDDPAFQIPEATALIRKMVSAGNFGRKTGKGFFEWNGNKVNK